MILIHCLVKFKNVVKSFAIFPRLFLRILGSKLRGLRHGSGGLTTKGLEEVHQ